MVKNGDTNKTVIQICFSCGEASLQMSCVILSVSHVFETIKNLIQICFTLM